MENKFIKFVLWILLIFFYIAASIYIGAYITSLHLHSKALINLLYILGEAFITLILVSLYRSDFKNKYKELKKDKNNDILKSSIKIWLVGLSLMILSNIVLSVIIGDIATNESANRSIISVYSIYAIISMIILTPICEEILFRLSPSKMIDNKILYVVFSGVIFGFIHVAGEVGLQTLYVIPYASLGASFAYIYQKHQNILCSILMHAMHNTICILLIYFL